MKVSVLTISHTAKANALQLYSSVQFTGWTPCCDHLRVCCVYRCQYLPTTAPALNSRSTGALEGIPVLGYIWDRSVSVFECECGHSSTSPPPAEHCWQNWSTHQSTPPCSRRPWNIPSLCQSSRNTAWTRQSLSSYRPISNLPFVSKLLERIVAGQLTTYLNTNHLLPTHHSAYHHYHSTETALLAICNDALIAADRGMVTLIVLLDLSAASDTVKLQTAGFFRTRFGITDAALNWHKLTCRNDPIE